MTSLRGGGTGPALPLTNHQMLFMREGKISASASRASLVKTSTYMPPAKQASAKMGSPHSPKQHVQADCLTCVIVSVMKSAVTASSSRSSTMPVQTIVATYGQPAITLVSPRAGNLRDQVRGDEGPGTDLGWSRWGGPRHWKPPSL